MGVGVFSKVLELSVPLHSSLEFSLDFPPGIQGLSKGCSGGHQGPQDSFGCP